MATYVLLVKLTDKGAADIKNVPERIEQTTRLWRSSSSSWPSAATYAARR
jgi:uncharacterized protein with GYD domain